MDKRDVEINRKFYRLKLDPAVINNMNRISQQMTQVNKSMQYLQKHFAEISKVINHIIPPTLPKYVQQLEEYIRRKDIAIPFTEYGLWITPSMTPALVMKVMKRYEQGRKRTIPAVIDGFYRQNNWGILRHAVEKWKPYEFFVPRMPIFYDALEAHIGKKWTLTIPTLIPHIEGIAGEILLANKLPFTKNAIILPKGQKTYASSLFDKLPADKVTPTMDVIISSLLYYLEGTLYEYKDFKDFPKIRRLKKLNRHAVMHGYQINYATRLNSLRCFLALDSLSMMKGNIPKLV